LIIEFLPSTKEDKVDKISISNKHVTRTLFLHRRAPN